MLGQKKWKTDLTRRIRSEKRVFKYLRKLILKQEIGPQEFTFIFKKEVTAFILQYGITVIKLISNRHVKAMCRY